MRYADCLGLTVTKTSTYLSPYSSVQLSLQVPPPTRASVVYELSVQPAWQFNFLLQCQLLPVTPG